MAISFYERFHAPQEQAFVSQCLQGALLSENAFGGQALAAAQEIFHTPYLLYTPSCSAALELAVASAGIGCGDEVILPSFNFPSAANAVLRCGATPVFCDIEAGTQNISVSDAARRITKHTKAVIAVHYAGVSADMDALRDFCSAEQLLLIEDAAQGIGAAWDGLPLGTLGDFGAISFHATKNITCGEGGLLCVSPAFWERAQIFRMHGTDRSRMLNGEQDYYTWQQAGSCYLLSELCQSVLCAQLPCLCEITEKRLAVAAAYNDILRDAPVQRMEIPKKATYNGHIYYVRFENSEVRNHVMHVLAAHDIQSATHYFPLHMGNGGKALGYQAEDLPESRRCYETLLRLPIHCGISVSQAQTVAEIVKKALK